MHGGLTPQTTRLNKTCNISLCSKLNTSFKTNVSMSQRIKLSFAEAQANNLVSTYDD